MSDTASPRSNRALTRLIRRALLPTSGDETRAAAGVGLDRAAYHVLLRPHRRAAGPGALSALAERVGLDVSTVSRHVTTTGAGRPRERDPRTPTTAARRCWR